MLRSMLSEFGSLEIRYHRDDILASNPGTLVFILGVPESVSLDVAEIYRWHCLEQWTKVGLIMSVEPISSSLARFGCGDVTMITL